MKNVLNIALVVSAMAFAFVLSLGNTAEAAVGQTDLGGIACNTGTDIVVTTYDIDYGTAAGADFIAGFTNAGTKSAANVSLDDACGTAPYDVESVFSTMVGADNSDVIATTSQGIVQTLGSPYYTQTAGNLGDDITGYAGNWSGNSTITLFSNTTPAGAVGTVETTLSHHLTLTAGQVVYDSSYDGTWTTTINF